MSVRQLAIDLRIAEAAGAEETRHMMRLGASVRDAIEAGCRTRDEILKIARQPDNLFWWLNA